MVRSSAEDRSRQVLGVEAGLAGDAQGADRLRVGRAAMLCWSMSWASDHRRFPPRSFSRSTKDAGSIRGMPISFPHDGGTL
jgi:hypothetical protein